MSALIAIHPQYLARVPVRQVADQLAQLDLKLWSVPMVSGNCLLCAFPAAVQSLAGIRHMYRTTGTIYYAAGIATDPIEWL